MFPFDYLTEFIQAKLMQGDFRSLAHPHPRPLHHITVVVGCASSAKPPRERLGLAALRPPGFRHRRNAAPPTPRRAPSASGPSGSVSSAPSLTWPTAGSSATRPYRTTPLGNVSVQTVEGRGLLVQGILTDLGRHVAVEMLWTDV